MERNHAFMQAESNSDGSLLHVVTIFVTRSHGKAKQHFVIPLEQHWKTHNKSDIDQGTDFKYDTSCNRKVQYKVSRIIEIF